MQDNVTMLGHSRAANFKFKSTNYNIPVAELVSIINKSKPTDDKKNGALIYFGRYPTGTEKREYSTIEAITALPLDYDGRNGDTLTRTEAERIVAAAGIHAILWNSFSSDGSDTTFRLVLLLSQDTPFDISYALTRSVAEKIGLPLPLSLLAPTQGFFFAPREGGTVPTNARHIVGTGFADQLVEEWEFDTFELNKDVDEESGVHADGTDELTDEQLSDTIEVLNAIREAGGHLSNGSGVWHRVAQSLCKYKAGEELFLMFSEGDPEFSERDCRQKLAQKRKGHATSIGHLFRLASDVFGIENPAKQRRRAADPADVFGDEFGEELPPMYCDTLTADEMTQRFCFIEHGQQIVDRKNPKRVLSRPDFQAAYLPSWTPTPTDTDPNAKTSSTKLWMFNPGKMQLATTTWRPGYPERTVDPLGTAAYNTFRVRKLPPFEFSQSYVDMFLSHVDFLFGDRAEHFLDWFSHIEQFPGVLPHTAWLNIATQTGLGRNWLTSLARQMWPGEVAANYDLTGQIEGTFNDALSKKRLIMVDEIRVAGQGGHKVEQRLKSIINEETREVNPKYGRKSVEYNCARWLMFSNHRSAIPMDNTDRRYEVVINNSKPKPLSYYANLYGAVKHKDFALSVLTYLRQRDISDFNPGQRAVLSEAKMKVVESSRSVLEMTIRDVLEGYEYPVITGLLLRQLGGLGADTLEKLGYVVARIMEDCGWVKVGFVKKHGSRSAAYCRDEDYSTYKGLQSSGMPTDEQIAAMLAISTFGDAT